MARATIQADIKISPNFVIGSGLDITSSDDLTAILIHTNKGLIFSWGDGALLNDERRLCEKVWRDQGITVLETNGIKNDKLEKCKGIINVEFEFTKGKE